MGKKGKINRISNETTRMIVGIFICLFSIYLSLNLVETFPYDFLIYIARAINYVLTFFVGGIFSYIIYLFLFLYGISLIFPKKHIVSRWGIFITGAILALLGGEIIFANSVTFVSETSFLTFSNYIENFELVYKTDDFFRILIEKNPGIIGLTLTSLFNSIFNSYITSYVVGVIILLVGIALLLINPIKYLIKVINDYKNFNYKYSPKNAFTKAKDLTLTTTALEVLDDSDDDIEVVSQPQNLETINKVELYDRLKGNYKEDDDTYFDDTLKPVSQASNDFLDEPLTRAKFNFNNENITPTNFEEVEDNPFPFDETTPISELNKQYQKEHNRIDFALHGNDVTESNYREVNTNVNVTPTFSYLKDIENGQNKPKKVKRRNKYMAPSTGLLENRTSHESEQQNKQVAEERSDIINQTLSDLNVKARVVSYKIGPSVTRYDIQTERSESIRGFDSYVNDICIRLGGINARFSPIVLGKTTSGLEIANAVCSMVNFKDCLIALQKLPKAKKTNIPFGKDINNELLTVDLQETPHLLVSGTTGSGKSIFVHSLIMTLLMRNSPDELKLVLIDPKTVELTRYREIPHLLCPPIGIEDPQKPYEVLLKLCDMMEERYRLFSETDCSKLKEYNEWAVNNGKEPLPVIVVVIDEYADLIENNKRISEPVVRIGQKARAAGIHMVVATQRPSVNVINGVIKANIPSRVALLSSSYTDSNTILDQGGAEKLIGNGDMLIKCALLSNTFLIRCQGAYVSNMEIKAVCDFLRSNYSPEYDEEVMEILNKPIEGTSSLLDSVSSREKGSNPDENLYIEVKKWTMSEEYISISRIQNTFSMGFNRASRIFKRLQHEGIVSTDSASNSSKGSKVLVHNYDTEDFEYKGSVDQSTFRKDY